MQTKSEQCSIKSIAQKIQTISGLPDVVARVFRVVCDDNSSATDLRRVVEADPALAAKVLKTVNSASAGVRIPVTTIPHAISMLGFRTIRNLAITISIHHVFRSSKKIGDYRRQDLWRHMVAVAVIARMILARNGSPRFEEAFLAGLLHDLGIILLDQAVHGDFVSVLQQVHEGVSYLDAEKAHFGFDHAELGATVGAQWHFAPSIVDAIRHHHDSSAADTIHREVASAVEIANFLAWAKGIPSTGPGTIPTPKPEVFTYLTLDRDNLEVLWDDIDRELELAKDLIELHEGGAE